MTRPTRVRAVRFFKLVPWSAALAASLAGCPEPPPTPDTGRRDAGRDTARDTAMDDIFDAGGDIETSDTGTTDAMDEGVIDAGVLDTGTVNMGDVGDVGDVGVLDAPPIDVVDTDTGTPVDVGMVDTGPASCMAAGTGAICVDDNGCPGSDTCIATGCGTIKRCQPAGRTCADNRDCQAGTQTCIDDVCVAVSTADCGDTRACPLGYLCEGTAGARRCVDHRKRCTIEQDCPYGSSCFAGGGLAPFCVTVPTRCNDTFACLFSAQCIDVDGDSLKECVPFGFCLQSDCPDAGAGNTCEMPRDEFGSACGLHGICSTQRPCAAGFNCIDMWNTGVKSCHPVGNTCATHAVCTTPGTLCYDVNTPETPGPAGCR